ERVEVADFARSVVIASAEEVEAGNGVVEPRMRRGGETDVGQKDRSVDGAAVGRCSREERSRAELSSCDVEDEACIPAVKCIRGDQTEVVGENDEVDRAVLVKIDEEFELIHVV